MKLILTDNFKYKEDEIYEIKKLGYKVRLAKDNEKIKRLDSYEANVIVGKNFFLYNNIVDFKNLKMIQLTTAGLDTVPYDYIVDNNITLNNAEDTYSIPIAEWVMLNVLEIYKNNKFFRRNQRSKIWKKNLKLLELNGKNMIILGTGSIGKETAKRFKAFNTKIVGINRDGRSIDYFDETIKFEDIDKYIGDADILVSCLPKTKDTENMIDKNLMSKMKDGSVLINVSRGGIVNEEDLIYYLNRDKFRGVALDVFEKEPLKKNSSLWDFENVSISPHNSFASDNINERLYKVIYKNLKIYRDKITK